MRSDVSAPDRADLARPGGPVRPGGCLERLLVHVLAARSPLPRAPPGRNRRALEGLASTGPGGGLLAYDGTLAVGWCLLAPRAELAWLARARYVAPVDDLPVWSVPCFFVRRSHRGQGVTGALIDAAVEAASAAGAPALEAYPVDTAVAGHTRNLFPGVASAFAQRGFEVVARRKADRPIMRTELRSPAD